MPQDNEVSAEMADDRKLPMLASRTVQHIRANIDHTQIVRATGSMPVWWPVGPGDSRTSQSHADYLLREVPVKLDRVVREQGYQVLTQIGRWFVRDGVSGHESPQSCDTWEEALTITMAGHSSLVYEIRALVVPQMEWPFSKDRPLRGSRETNV